MTAYVDPTCGLYAGVEEPVERMRELTGCGTDRGGARRGDDDGPFGRRVERRRVLPQGAALAAYLPGAPTGAFIEGLAPEPGDTLVPKQYPSAFFGTSLAADLVARGVDTLFIAGLSTSGCVRATATDAMQHGFVPIVVREAVGDRLPSVHEANLFDIAAKIGEVWPMERVLEHWGGA